MTDLRDRLQTILQYEPAATLRGALEVIDREDASKGSSEFKPEAWVDTCSCGHVMGIDEYRYYGGTFGYYDCTDCGRTWESDLNGGMRQVIHSVEMS